MVADFDKQNWKEETVSFLNACKEKNIPAYLERSCSGNGGHVWIFFEKPYPSVRSRKIFISILEQSGVFSMFDKSSSFDKHITLYNSILYPLTLLVIKLHLLVII